MSADLSDVPLGNTSIPETIYFFGDSITLGWRDEEHGGWPARLMRRLWAGGLNVTGYNLGIRGDTSDEIVDRWEDEVGRRRRSGDALVIFAFGVNDSKVGPDGRRVIPLERTVNNLRRILERAHRHRILLVGPAPIDEDLMHRRLNAGGLEAMPTRGSIAETTRSIADEARSGGVPFLDLLAALASSAPWQRSLSQTDGLHPSSAGHDLIATKIQAWTAWTTLFPNA